MQAERTASVNVRIGDLTAIGIVLREFPERIVTYALLLRGDFSQQRSTILAFLAAALTTPLGTLLSFPMISQIEKPLLGALVYVSATHLLTHAEHEPRKYSLVALLGGGSACRGNCPK